MSGSKWKATSTSNTNSTGSDSKHNSSGAQAHQRVPRTGTTRMRTRSQAKALRPPTPKRPKLRHDTRQDNVFAIKDIIDEKFIHGKRHYKIDWQDDPNTGESFSPTWVCQPSSQHLRPWTNHLCRSPQRTQTRTLSRTGSGTSSAVPCSVSPRSPSPTLNPLRPQHLERHPPEASLLSCSPSRIS